MVLEWMSILMIACINWNNQVCGVGGNDCVGWEGLSCLWLPLLTMEVWITWIYLAVLGSATPILLHDHEMLGSCPVPLLLHWPLNCTDGKVRARAQLGLVWQCLTAGSWNFSVHSKLLYWVGLVSLCTLGSQVAPHILSASSGQRIFMSSPGVMSH